MDANEILASRSRRKGRRRDGWNKTKYRIRQVLHRYPPLEAIAVRAWRQARFSLAKLIWKLETRIGSRLQTHVHNIDFDRIYCVSTDKIIFSSLREFSINYWKGHILGGDWDRLEKRFDSLDLYIAIKQVCVEGKNWADTVYYRRALEGLKVGRGVLHFGNEVGLQSACRAMETLYHAIQREGYMSQRALFLAGRIQDPMVAEEEVAVSIGRYGDLLFCDGAHRLAIAKVLKLSEIPVKIAVRHKEWVHFRHELERYAQLGGEGNRGQLYQPLTHPDLSDLPASHESRNRYQLIHDNLPLKHGLLLDIGANLGYFCHRFEEDGFDCWAVENDQGAVYFLERLARAENRRFKILSSSIFDCPEIRTTRFNVVLALNIFHHFLKTQEDYERLVVFLENLQVDELFFEPHLPGEGQMEGSYRNYSPEEFVEFILQHSKLKGATLLGAMQDGRPIYRLH